MKQRIKTAVIATSAGAASTLVYGANKLANSLAYVREVEKLAPNNIKNYVSEEVKKLLGDSYLSASEMDKSTAADNVIKNVNERAAELLQDPLGYTGHFQSINDATIIIGAGIALAISSAGLWLYGRRRSNKF